MSQSDTSQDAADLQVTILRSKTTSERLALTFALSESTINLSKRAIHRAHPHLSEDELRWLFVELHYGKDLADKVRRYSEERGCAEAK